jgi:hypothetical protein
MVMGRDHDHRRVHGCLIHIDIIDHQLWIQRDGTENGIANSLISAGVPRQHITIFGFRSPKMSAQIVLDE